MTAKSKAQFRKMAVLLKEGKITKSQFDDFDKGVDFKKLPERVKPKKVVKRLEK